jgi:hypothetical protein
MEARAYRGRGADCQIFASNRLETRRPLLPGRRDRGSFKGMIKRSDVLYLGLASGVIGSLLGGMMLGVGMSLIIGGAPVGWLLLLPAAPVGGVPGWILAKRLVRGLPPDAL